MTAHSLRPAVLALAVFLAGLSVAVAVAIQWQGYNDAVVAKRLESLAEQTMERLTDRLRRYEYGLRGARGMAVATGMRARIDRAQFHTYSEARDIDAEFPGARGIGLIWRVPVAEESVFVTRARQDGWPTFTIRQLAPHARDRYVIQYIEPVARNQQAIGLDIASEERRRQGAISAAQRGQATLTAPITLVQASGKTARSFLLLLPIYDSSAPPASQTEREARAVGWSYAPLAIDEVLSGVMPPNDLATLELRDVSDPAPQVFFSVSGPVTEASALRPHTVSRTIFGRQWEAEFRALPRFAKAQNLVDPLNVAGFGIGVTLILSLLSFASVQGRAGQASLRAQQARHAAMLASTSDAIIGQDVTGRVTDWNPAAERLFGHTAASVIGRKLEDFLLPPELLDQDKALRASARANPQVAPVDTVRLTASGLRLDVSVSIAAILDARGQCLGYTKSVRDISAARRAAQQALELNDVLEARVHARTLELETAKRDLQTILDAVPSQIGYWDRELRNRMANAAYHDWFGVAPATLRGKHMRELLGEKAYATSLPYLEAALRGEQVTFEEVQSHDDGRETRYALVNYVPDIVDGTVCGVYTIVHDISEVTKSRLALANALRDQQALLTTLDTHAIVSVADRHGDILAVNENFCRISGYTREELIGQSHRIINSGHHPREFWVGMWKTIATGQSWRADVCNRAKDGSLYWADSIIAPFVDGEGKIEKYVSIRHDLTARKQAERQLIETSKLLQGVLDAATETSIIAVDAAQRITLFNRGAERSLGYAADTAVARLSLRDFHDPDEMRARAHELSEATGRAVGAETVLFDPETLGIPREWLYVRQDGTRLETLQTITPLSNGDHVTGYLSVAQNISQQKALEISLREALQNARQAEAAKSRFLANMSHEIRTPLNAVLGLTQMLEGTALDREQADLVRKVRLGGKSLLAIINDVLDLSKIDAGELHIEHTDFSLRDVLRDLQTLMETHAHLKGLLLETQLSHALPACVRGDPLRLHQILANLVSNAIKFTEHGRVLVSAAPVPAEGETVRVRFAVHDQGIGIPPDAQARIFEPFSQADISTTRRFGGTGLGLSIVRQLVRAMHGSLRLDSEVGVGSCFTVEITFEQGAASQPARAGAPGSAGERLDGLTILIVDDADINLLVAKGLLSRQGASVILASGGEQAIGILRTQPDRIDLVLMDVHMPGIDGLQATQMIRHELGLTQLPIIALSASALASERQAALDAGMNDFISKPFEMSHLSAIVSRHLPQRARRASAPVTPPATAVTPAWPQVDEIDLNDARRRLGGDSALFRQSLKGLLIEFDDARLRELLARGEPCVAFLHKLRGIASSVGATALGAAAGRAEDAFRSGDTSQGMLAADEAASRLQRLRAATQSVLSPPAPQSPAEASEALPPLDIRALEALRARLLDQDMAALNQFEQLEASLREHFGAARIDRIQTSIQRLNFTDALQALDAVGIGMLRP